MKKFSNILFIVALSTFLFSCGKTEDTDSFGKKEMFTNYADNLILPAYTTYGNSLTALQTALTNFNTTADLSNLETLQTAFLTTYAVWQSCEIYDKTPPADAVMALENTNYYPCRNDSIEAYISRNDNSVVSLSNKVKSDKGLAAVEYLLFSRTLTLQQILERFTTNPNAASYKTYLTSLVSNITNIQTDIIYSWAAYREIFINSLGTDASGSFSLMVNSIAQRTDDFKRMQTGIPAGYLGNVATVNILPAAVQAYYSNNSTNYMLLTLNNMKDVLNGKGTTDGKGLIDYIRTLNVTSTFGGNLADDILAQIDICITKVNDCAPDYSSTVVSNKPKADALFLESKKLLVLIKVDVPSALGVSITYTDSDGD
jgi:uncharacterized protein